MRVELNEYGTLTVTAETPLEIYALRCWSDSYFGQTYPPNTDKASLAIDARLPPKGSSTFKDEQPGPVIFTPTA